MPITTTLARVISRADDLKVYGKVSARQLAVLANLSPTVLGNAFQGVTYLGAQKEQQLSEITLILVGLELSLRPLRLPERTDDLRDLVNRVRENNVDLEKLKEAVQPLLGVREEGGSMAAAVTRSDFQFRANPESTEEF
jgi:hypothetical protein